VTNIASVIVAEKSANPALAGFVIFRLVKSGSVPPARCETDEDRS